MQIQPELAKAKSEALDNIYSLFKQNKKQCNTLRRRQRRRTVKNSNRSNQQKSNFARAAHFFCTFLCRCFARLQRETSRNFLVTRFMEEMSYVFSFTFFSLPLIFTLHWWPLAFLILSPPFCHKIFILFFQQKKCLLRFFISRSKSLSPFFSLSYGSPLSLFLCLSLALYSKFVDMTINLSLILQKTRIQRQFPLSIFLFIDSLVVSALQDAGGYAISRQNNLELHLGCHTC